MYGPKTGPSQAALRSARAWPVYRRAMKLFCASQRELIAYIILSNWTVRRWCEHRCEQGLPARQAVEMGRLLAILDVLVEHFKTEIERDIGRGAAGEASRRYPGGTLACPTARKAAEKGA